jgi:YHS domain-containing protein
MKSIHQTFGLCALAFGLIIGGHAFAADHSKHHEKTGGATAKMAGELVKLTEKDAAWAAKARAAYPLKVCLTSDEKLGSMGDNAEYIYREKGKPDRLIVFCCDGCEDDFKKEPAKYLAKLDAAAKQKK